MRGKLRDYFGWKASLGKMQRNLKRYKGGSSASATNNNSSNSNAAKGNEGAVQIQESSAMKKKREMMSMRGKAPSGKRRRIRGGGNVAVGDGGRVDLAQRATADSGALEAEAGEIADL